MLTQAEIDLEFSTSLLSTDFFASSRLLDFISTHSLISQGLDSPTQDDNGRGVKIGTMAFGVEGWSAGIEIRYCEIGKGMDWVIVYCMNLRG